MADYCLYKSKRLLGSFEEKCDVNFVTTDCGFSIHFAVYSTANLKNKINEDEKMGIDSKNKNDVDAETEDSNNPREDLLVQKKGSFKGLLSRKTALKSSAEIVQVCQLQTFSIFFAFEVILEQVERLLEKKFSGEVAIAKFFVICCRFSEKYCACTISNRVILTKNS